MWVKLRDYEEPSVSNTENTNLEFGSNIKRKGKLKSITRRGMIAAAGTVGLGALAASRSVFANTQQPVAPESGKAKPDGRFKDRVVLITGATSGIGEGTAYAFAREGAKVFFCGRRENLGKKVEARIRGFGGEATFMRADVRNEVDVKAFIDGCVKKYGRIDIAFNNAGIDTPKRGSIDEQPLADFENVMRTNAFGVFLSMKYEVPVLLQNEPWGAFGTRGVVVNNASTSGHVGFANISPYSASKHALLGLTRCAALEYSPRGVRVVSISPGGVDTPMRHRAYEGRVAPGQPDPPAPNLYQRTNTVAEMADVVMFLASDAGSSLTGVDLDVTGGYHTGAHITTARR